MHEKSKLFLSDRPLMYQINIGGNFEETSKDFTNLIMSNGDIIVVIIFNKSVPKSQCASNICYGTFYLL